MVFSIVIAASEGVRTEGSSTRRRSELKGWENLIAAHDTRVSLIAANSCPMLSALR
jgi:hypothetical protein